MPRRYGALGVTRVDLATALESQYAAPTRVVGPLRATLPVQADQAFTSVTVSSFLALPDGSATAPALRYQNEAQTGLFRPGAGFFAWTVLGTERMRIGNSGLHVGSGYTAPPVGGIRTEGQIVVEGQAGQFDPSLTLQVSTHATSRRVGIALDVWTVGQDAAGSGVKDLFFFDGVSGLHRLRIATTGAADFQGNAVSMGALTATIVTASSAGSGAKGIFESTDNFGGISVRGAANQNAFVELLTGGSKRGGIETDEITDRILIGALGGGAATWDVEFHARAGLRAFLTNLDFKPATAGGLTLGTISLPWGTDTTFNYLGTTVVQAPSGSAALVLGTTSKHWTLYLSGSDLRLFEYTTTIGGGGNERAVFVAGGNFILGTTTPATGNPRLDVVGVDELTAAIIGASSTTNVTNKTATFGVRHYTNAEETFAAYHAAITSANAFSRIGGGHAQFNAATVIEFYTAANTTTLTGTLRMELLDTPVLKLHGTGFALDFDDDNAVFKRAGVTKLTLASASATFVDIGIFPASTTSAASIRLPHGSAPTTPTNGDIWTTTTGVFARINGATTGPFGTVESGTYTPTITDNNNVGASTAYVCQYARVGNTVVVSGQVDIDPVLASTNTSFWVTLPIASAFTADRQCGGTCATRIAAASEAGSIHANATRDEAEFNFFPSSAANRNIFFIFSYTVI